MPIDGRGVTVPVPREPSVTSRLNFGKASSSAPFRSDTVLVRLVSNADMHIAFGPEPEATQNSEFIPARCEAFRRITPGHKVSAYDGVSE